MISSEFPDAESFQIRIKPLLNPDRIKSIVLYHGTSSSYLDSILKDGIISRRKTGSARHWDSRRNRVYFGPPELAIYLANVADACVCSENGILKGGAVVEVELDASILLPDENSYRHGYKKWYESLLSVDAVASEQPIPPDRILRVWASNGPWITNEDGKLIYMKSSLNQIEYIKY